MPDDLKPAYLIAGGDRPKVDRAVARLRGRFDADAVEVHDAAEATGEDAVAACNALGLFGSGGAARRVRRRRGLEGARREGVAEYLKSPAPGRRWRSSAGS